MKQLLLLSVFVFFAFSAFSQRVYLADTAFTTDVGYGGAPASCMAPHTEYFGWHMSRPLDVWLADEFIIPADSTWAFDTVIVYGYQQGSGTTSTFEHCYLQVRAGTPTGGGSVIWGDTVTDVMVSTGFTGIYRVDTVAADGGLTSTERPIMYLKLFLSPAPVLSAGSYWLSWAATGSLAAEPACPDKVNPGRFNPSGQVAKQFYSGTWHDITDSGQTIGMDMIIKASAAVAGISNVNKTPVVALSQNIPNPFSGSTDISFYTGQPGYAVLAVYNAIGQLAATLLDGTTDGGEHHLTFNAGNLPAGVYFYRLSTSFGSESRQMVVVR